MKIKQIREMSSGEIAARSHELREEKFHLRIRQQSGQLEQPSQIRTIRREIARLTTIFNEKSKAARAISK